MARALSIEPTGLKRREDRIMESCYDHGPDIWNYVGEHCSTEEIAGYLPVAIKADNAVFAEYLLQQLANREEPEVFVEELVKIVGKKINIGSGFDSAVRSVLAMNCERLGLGPVLSNYENCQCFPMKAKDLLKGTRFAECKRFALQDDEVEHDGRLDEFLKGFEKFGSAIIEVGYCFISGELDFFNVLIREGKISHEDSKKILSFLDIVGIKEALPVFRGEWLKRYYLEGSAWYLEEEDEGDRTWWFRIECLAYTDT